MHYSFLPFSRLYPDTPSLVLSPLKLAIKYQADVLRNRIVAHTCEDCPTTLEDWDEVAYSESSPAKSDPSDETSEPLDYSTKDFLPDPISFMALARECNLPAVFATLLYSLCRYSTARKEKLSRMTKEDLETLFLGKDRMIRWISGPAADILEIQSWISEDYYNSINCNDRACHPPLFKTWSNLLEDVMSNGDPLATFREAVLKYRKNDFVNDSYRSEIRDEICCWCEDRLANKLDDLRHDLFDQLPSFFPLLEINPEATQD